MSLIPRDLRPLVQRKGRLVSVLAVLSLALGIAGSAVVFSIVESLLYRPLPYPEADRVVLLGQREKDRPAVTAMSILSSHAVWADFRERSRTLTRWAAFNPGWMGVSQGDRSVSVMVGRATASLFESLGARPVRGRLFTEEESRVGGPKVVLLSWEYWQDTWGPESDPVGSTITLDGTPHQVVGVVNRGFEFLVGDVSLWMPLQSDPYLLTRDSRSVVSSARVAPGFTLAEAKAEVARIAEDLEAEFPEEYSGWTNEAIHLATEFPDANSRRYMMMLQGAVLFVLLIACANITSLLLARAQDRRKEIALKMALGAGRLRVLGQLTRESMLLAGAGGLVGLALAAWGIRIVAAEVSKVLSRQLQPALDGPVLLFTLIITVLCGLIFGLVPGLQSLRQDHVEALKAGAGSGGGRRRGRIIAGLVVTEIALCLVALGGGSVLASGFLAAQNDNLGFRRDGLLTVRFEVPDWKYRDSAVSASRIQEVRRRVEELPGVTAAALVNEPPLNLFPPDRGFVPDELEQPGRRTDEPAISVVASPEYLETMGIPLLQGRFFVGSDRGDAPRVAVVNRALARRYFPGESPVGRRVRHRSTAWEIVGVVGDTRQSLAPRGGDVGEPTIYIPTAQWRPEEGYLILRARGDPETLAEPVRSAVWRIDPDITIHSVETLTEYANRYTAFGVFSAIFSGFGLLALLLAAVGTYGVVAYSVGGRTHEIGVRLAVGARPAGVVAMCARQGLWMSTLGLLLGALILVPVIRAIAGVLEGFGQAPVEPVTLGVVSLLLLGATLAATLVPSGRAASVDPVKVLRVE